MVLGRSGRGKRPLDRLGIVLNHFEQDESRRLWAPALFAIAQRTSWDATCLLNAPSRPSLAVSGSFRSNTAEMLRAAALDGIGIAVLPSWVVAEPLRAGVLRRVLPVWTPPTSTIYAVYPGNRLMAMKVRAFVDHLARCFGRTPYWDTDI